MRSVGIVWKIEFKKQFKGFNLMRYVGSEYKLSIINCVYLVTYAVSRRKLSELSITDLATCVLIQSSEILSSTRVLTPGDEAKPILPVL